MSSVFRLAWFIFSRTFMFVWDEWDWQYKKDKHHLVFWLAALFAVAAVLYVGTNYLPNISNPLTDVAIRAALLGSIFVFGAVCWVGYIKNRPENPMGLPLG